VVDTLLEQYAADVANMYDTTHGLAITVTGPSGAFAAVFDHEYSRETSGGRVGAASALPFLKCLDADALAKGATVTVAGDTYTVVEPMPNGKGETIMRLQKT